MPTYERKMRPVKTAALNALPTRQLLGLRDRLLRLEEAPESSDLRDNEIDAAFMQFKSDPRWRTAYDAVRGALAARGHVVNAVERRARQQVRKRREREGRKDRPRRT
ncbi:MAG: hypothetical protein QM765_21235 [Myxococcales bacterium]